MTDSEDLCSKAVKIKTTFSPLKAEVKVSDEHDVF